MHVATPAVDKLLVRPDTALIGVSGEDATAFLQGQLTVDCAALAPGEGTLTALCTPQGRVIAVLRLFRLAHGYALALPAALGGPLAGHLERYRLRARIDIERIDQTCHLVAVQGRLGRESLAQLEHSDELQEHLMAGATPQEDPEGERRWMLLAIAAGLPDVLPTTSELFLPQWLNLDLVGGMSFSKGCYVGQEVVSRAQHRGRATRRLLRLAYRGAPLPPGSTLRAGTEPLGQVLLSAPLEVLSECLAVIRLDCQDRLPEALPGLEHRELPYRLPER